MTTQEKDEKIREMFAFRGEVYRDKSKAPEVNWSAGLFPESRYDRPIQESPDEMEG